MTTKHTKEKKMSTLYKLTDSDGQTRGGTQWGPGVSHSGTGKGELCGPGWIHAYEHPLIAVLLNPIHADFQNPRLWEAKGEVGLRDTGQLKCGCKTLTTIREIPLPEITEEMRARFAILCAKEVCLCSCSTWKAWANKWLSGEDRSVEAAKAAARAAWAAEDAAAAAAAAARAARAAWAAAAWAAEAAYRPSWAAKAAALTAWAAELAACCGMDLAAIAENACSGLRNFA